MIREGYKMDNLKYKTETNELAEIKSLLESKYAADAYFASQIIKLLEQNYLAQLSHSKWQNIYFVGVAFWRAFITLILVFK